MKPVEELFHISKDPLEMHNLAKNPEFRPVLETMRRQYDLQLVHWKKNAVKYNDYAQYAEVFDRSVLWEGKKNLYHRSAIKSYEKEKKVKCE